MTKKTKFLFSFSFFLTYHNLFIVLLFYLLLYIKLYLQMWNEMKKLFLNKKYEICPFFRQRAHLTLSQKWHNYVFMLEKYKTYNYLWIGQKVYYLMFF